MRGRTFLQVALTILVGLPVPGFITCELVLDHRYKKAIVFVSEFVASVRTGSTQHRESLARASEDEMELNAARAWMTPESKVLCDLHPPLSFTSYECWVTFRNGGVLSIDIYPAEKCGQWRVYVRGATPPWERCASCHPKM